MVENDFIKDLFADKLANAEAPVNPELWNAISAKVAGQTVSTGLSSAAKFVIGLGTAATITVASVLYFSQKEEQPKKENKALVSNNEPLSENTLQQNSIETVQPSSKVAQTAVSQALSTEEIRFIEPNEVKEEALNQDIISFPDPENSVSEKQDQQRNKEVFPLNKTKENTVADKVNTNTGADSQEKTNERSSIEIGELPNVFTPNSDNDNDFFFIPVKGIQDFVLTVLNQDNETVFRTTDPNFKWDGRDAQGNLIPSGTRLIYFFTGKSTQGDTISRHNRLEIRY
jgi:hypothetical protein